MLGVQRLNHDEPPLEEQFGLAAPLLLVCDVSVASYVFFSYRYFILLRQTAWAQAEEYFPRRLQREREGEHIGLSALFQTVWFEWAELGTAGKRQVEKGISVCPSGKLWREPGIPTPCGHNCTSAPFAGFFGLSLALFPLMLLKTPQDVPNGLARRLFPFAI